MSIKRDGPLLAVEDMPRGLAIAMNKLVTKFLIAVLAICWSVQGTANACTGLTLKAADGAVVYGRTMEWGAFDLNSRLVIVPRGYQFAGHTPDGEPGFSWKGQYGAVGLDAVGKDFIVDGMNEKGLAAGAFYLPGFTKYQTYEPAEAGTSLGPMDVVQYLLTQFATVDEVRAGLQEVRVVPTVEPVLGFPPPLHFFVADPSGKSIVVEYLDGQLSIFDSPLGVVTNAPSYDWHMTNLRNYINLSAVALPGKKLEDLNFTPLGAGSGMIGLPGDFTPPSRFVRAIAFTQTARPTEDGPDTVYEVLRILDNFNLPLSSAEGSDMSDGVPEGMHSSTIWTSLSDTKNRVFYYHTQNNRRLRMVDLKDIDFSPDPDGLQHFPLDKNKAQDIQDMTPRGQ
jgi:choloylglycine hydrolase